MNYVNLLSEFMILVCTACLWNFINIPCSFTKFTVYSNCFKSMYSSRSAKSLHGYEIFARYTEVLHALFVIIKVPIWWNIWWIISLSWQMLVIMGVWRTKASAELCDGHGNLERKKRYESEGILCLLICIQHALCMQSIKNVPIMFYGSCCAIFSPHLRAVISPLTLPWQNQVFLIKTLLNLRSEEGRVCNMLQWIM